MGERKVTALCQEDVDQVFLLRSPLPLPWSVAVHSWVVTSDADNELHRWEVWQNAEIAEPSWGHLHRDLFDPCTGMPLFCRAPVRWSSSLVGSLRDGASSIISFLEQRPEEYPYTDTYRFFGPNSNTFPQWLLDRFVPADVEMSWRAVGCGAARSLDG